MSRTHNDDKPAPLETGPGEQQDDNIDDLGNRPDGSEQDQPSSGEEVPKKPQKPEEKRD